MDETEKVAKERKQKRACHKRYYAKTANLYPRRSWTADEKRQVLEHSIPDSELSAKIQRSAKSIQEERRRLKKESD
ncbi:MAG: hypothetical protein LUG49_05560 [Oscillospiraceae bacterium]|nr:hypothetical protein [Oscillospiraceae bacterium]